MTSPQYKITWKTAILPVLGIAVFLAYIYLFNVDIQQIISTVQTANLQLITVATIAVMLDTLFFTIAWHSLIRFLQVKISLQKAFLFVWFAIFMDALIPAESVSGELGKVYLVNREQNGTAGKATASVVAHRLIGMGINIATLTVGAALLLAGSAPHGMIVNLMVLVIGATFVFLVLILLLCTREKWTLRLVNAVVGFVERVSRGRWKLERQRQELLETTKSFHAAMKEYGRAPKAIFTASLFSVISWLFSLATFYLVFISIGYAQISWSAILVISTIFVAIKSVPIGVPFEVGLPEVTLSTLLILFGVPTETSFTATILMRVLTFWLRFFIGFFAQQWIGIKTVMTNPQPKNSQSGS